MKKFIICLTIVKLCFVTSNALSSPLNVSDLLRGSAQLSPKIIQGQIKIREKQADILGAQGAFDTEIEQDIFSRERGFYDGTATDTKVVQPFQDYNAEVYTGYRTSRGTFPIYEDSYLTNDGEYYLGAKLSLWRDRDIDKDRFNIAKTSLKYDQEKAKLLATKLEIQEQALYYYWKWVFEAKTFKVYEHLLELANERQRQLEKQVKEGVLASIYLKENQQYILSRRNNLIKQKQKLNQSAIDLSLYYRDVNGDPIIPTLKNLPSNLMPVYKKETYLNRDYIKLAQRPELLVIDKQKRILEQEVDLSKNNLSPNLDLDVKVSRDHGEGSITRRSGEALFLLNFSVPLQRRTEKGALERVRALQSQLRYEEQIQIEKMKASLQKLSVSMDNLYEIYLLSKEEINVAKTMLKAEETRFKNGISDFFTLNIREEKIAKAELKRLDSQMKYFQVLGRYYALTADYEKLYIDL